MKRFLIILLTLNIIFIGQSFAQQFSIRPRAYGNEIKLPFKGKYFVKAGEKVDKEGNDKKNKGYHDYLKDIHCTFKGDKKKIIEDYKKEIKKANTPAEISDARKVKNVSLEKSYDSVYTSYAQAYSFHRYSALWLPVRNRFLARYYYTQNVDRPIEALRQNIVIVGLSEEQNSSIYSEIVSAYLLSFRLSLGVMVSRTEITELTTDEITSLTLDQIEDRLVELEEENSKRLNAQNLLAGGGNAVLNLSTPIFAFESNLEDLTLTASIYESVGFLLPEIGTFSDDLELTNNFGVQLDLWHDFGKFTGEGGQLAVFINARSGVYSNGSFVRPLRIGKESGISRDPNPSKNDFKRNSIFYATLSGGFEISNRFRLTATFPVNLYDELEDTFKPNISLNVIPFR